MIYRGAPLKRTQLDWDQFFYRMAELVATRSKDPDRKVGALLVSSNTTIAFGYNGLPGGVPDVFPMDKDLMLHAEFNCILHADVTEGTAMYVTRFPCKRCAETMKERGVAKLVAPRPMFDHPKWGPNWLEADAILVHASIKYVEVDW